MRSLLLCLGCVVALVAAPRGLAAEGEDPGADVSVKSGDRKALAATWWDEPTKGAPGVVLLHMEQSDRGAWLPLVSHLRARGIEVLALDMRGHGESLKIFKKRVDKRDPKVFALMHQDAIGGVRWLVKKGKCDPKRIAVVGAGVGCSVAIDTAQRYPKNVSVVVGLSPGVDHLGMDSLEHAKTYPADTPLLLLTHKSESEAGADKLQSAIPGSRLIVYDDAPQQGASDGPGWVYGTRMLGRVALVEQTVASFVAARTGSDREPFVLDGVVADEGDEGGAWTKAAKLSADNGVQGWAYRVGRRVVFAGRIVGHDKKALEVGMETHFAPGTSPSRASDPSMGFLEIATYDLGKGTCAWVEPLDSFKRSKATNVADRPRPPIRIVRTETGYTFEGEWITEYGDGPSGPVDPARVGLALLAAATIDARPRELAPGAIALPMHWRDFAVDIESR